MEFTSQERMPIDVVPLSEPKPKEWGTFADWLLDKDVPDEKKYKWIWHVKDFVTFNGLTKRDLCAALKFLAENTLEIETVETEECKIVPFKQKAD